MMPIDIWFEIELLIREDFGESIQMMQKRWWQCRMLNTGGILRHICFYRRIGT